MHERIRSVAVSRGVVRSGARVELELAYEILAETPLQISCVSRGFTIEVEPMQLRQGLRRCFVPFRVWRRADAKNHACLLRVDLGDAHTSLSITVLPRPKTFGALPAVG